MQSDIKALAFDVFGTCVDFRGSIIKECRALGKAKGLRVNWSKFADAWRAGYRPAMDRVRSAGCRGTASSRRRRSAISSPIPKLISGRRSCWT